MLFINADDVAVTVALSLLAQFTSTTTKPDFTQMKSCFTVLFAPVSRSAAQRNSARWINSDYEHDVVTGMWKYDDNVVI